MSWLGRRRGLICLLVLTAGVIIFLSLARYH
jgi:hypothetical protein